MWKTVLLMAASSLIICNTTNAAKNVEAGAHFKDLHGTFWAYDSIEKAVSNGFINGYSDGTFKPGKEVSRAEFIRMITDALKLPHTESGEPWYLPYVAVSRDLGILKDSDFKDHYEQAITRLEMIRIAIRAVKPIYMQDGTNDKNMVIFAAETGLIYGNSKGDLNLQGKVTRAEAVVVIDRVLTAIRGKPLDINEDAIQAAYQ